LLVAASTLAPQGRQYQTAFCPNTAQLEVAPSQKFWFEGSFGQKHMRVYFERGGTGVVGVFYNLADWAPITLGGQWIGGAQPSVALTAYGERESELGRLTGEITAGSFNGVWSASGTSDIPVHLKQTPQPKCDGSGPWKFLNDKRWPIGFSYPGTWRVNITAETITLTCPDPSLMAYEGSEIDVLQGTEANTVTSDFVQCGDKWIYGYGCKCENASKCTTAPAVNRDNMTILQGDNIEWRLYCRGGGYVGQGDGHRRVITFGDTWIAVQGQSRAGDLVDRIVATAKRRSL
jgi:hypothetical protein